TQTSAGAGRTDVGGSDRLETRTDWRGACQASTTPIETRSAYSRCGGRPVSTVPVSKHGGNVRIMFTDRFSDHVEVRTWALMPLHRGFPMWNLSCSCLVLPRHMDSTHNMPAWPRYAGGLIDYRHCLVDFNRDGVTPSNGPPVVGGTCTSCSLVCP